MVRPRHERAGTLYFDVAAGVTTFLLSGRYFEARAKSGRRVCSPRWTHWWSNKYGSCATVQKP
jgi:hypothetical protein